MQIYGPSQIDYDFDIGPVMLSDWVSIPDFELHSDLVADMESCSTTSLIIAWLATLLVQIFPRFLHGATAA